MTKQDILTEIRELRKMNPTARTPREFDEPPEQGSKQVDGNALANQILNLILEAGLSPSQARKVLDLAKESIDWGEEEVKKMSNH